jgi:tetratricopeptide (TPR) repeat protein
MTRQPRPRLPLWPFVGLFVLCSGVLLLAAPGTIKGKVTDGDGKPIKDVTITLKDETRGQVYTMKTDKKGNYYLMGIAPADYRMKFEKAGFQDLAGVVAIVPDKENVFDAVLVPAVAKPVQPAWEQKNLQAHDLYMQNKYEESLALYLEILAADPNVAFIQFDVGNCYYHLGNYEAAARSFREAVRLKPDFFEAYTNLANTYARLKRFEEAVPIFEEAIRSYPANGALYFSLGLLYLNSGQGSKAAACLEKAVALDPKNPSGYNSLGIAYTQAGDYARAVEYYEKYLGLITDLNEINRIKSVIEQLKPLIKK